MKEILFKPIGIQELYGGGNEAPIIKEICYESPVVSIITATEIGMVYGSGSLTNVTDNPAVQINMEPGIEHSK